MKKKVLLPSLIVAAAGAVPMTAMAEATANFGWVSEYIFRGVYQEDSSTYAGVDLNHDTGFYIGAWGADVGTGTEIDYYLGWGSEREGFSYSLGYTIYTYPDNFDEKYEEINLGFGYGIFALDYAKGKYKNIGLAASLGVGGGDVDYTFTSLTITPEMGPYYKVGLWGDDLEETLVDDIGDEAVYLEVGFTHTLEDHDVDLNFAWTYTDKMKSVLTNSGDFDGEAQHALTFGIAKNFTLDD